MAYDGWVEFAESEFINIARTAALAPMLGINVVWTRPEDVQWIATSLVESDYDDITTAPWYDPGYPASEEFAGFMPLSFTGLDDNSMESTPVEYVTDGGNPGKGRHATLPLVVSLAIIASTDRGAEYGKRYLDRLLAGRPNNLCQGNNLHYFRWPAVDSPRAHRRNVRLTRGTSVTRKTSGDCSVTWMLTFTLTAGDPYEYGDPQPSITELGGTVAGPGLVDDGGIVLIEEGCPVYDYTPIYDPLYPALVAPPSIPDFYPSGWTVEIGDTFERFWAQVHAAEPTHAKVVPFITLDSVAEARMVRVSVWDGMADTSDQCDPLFAVMVTYLPAGQTLYIDGEQQACYIWDGFSTSVRRADSLVYNADAKPVEWTKFNDPSTLLVTLDIFDIDSGSTTPEVRMDFAMIPKSD